MTFKGELFPFQQEAVNKMLERKSLLLAHGLGLGKTVSSIAALETLIDNGEAESILVICPASIKWQWKRQLDNFTDGALVTVIEGTKGDRRAQYRGVKRGDFEYTIMNYEQVVADWDIVRLLSFDAICCDEIVAIKNMGAKRSRHVKRLQASYRFGLSGQPIENRPEELFSIMQWIDPEVLGRYDIFDRTFIVRSDFGAVKYYKNLPLLRETMDNAMHRRTRKDVADQMPAVVEQSHIIDFDVPTARLYKKIAIELIDVINKAPKFSSFNLASHYAGVGDSGPMGEIMPRLMALRMLCDHPDLLKLSADNFDDPESILGSEYAATLRDNGDLEKLKGSSKMDVTLDVINDILDASDDNKVVLFSFFKPMLNILQKKMKVPSVLFTGDQTARERDEAIERFTKDKRCRVFLSSDAGGIGVDLPIANYLISYDLPWSSGKFEQRQGRILRISSKWPEVTLLSMLMKGSIEERMWDMLVEKSAISNAWMDGDGVDEQGTFSVTLGSLKDFLQENL
jgi:SNF2 family DNA or RNA helicase